MDNTGVNYIDPSGNDSSKNEEKLEKEIIELKKENRQLKKELKNYELTKANFLRLHNEKSIKKIEYKLINSNNRDKQNRLQVALRDNNDNEASWLIQNGIDLYHIDNNDRTALQYAIQMDKKNLVIEMLKAGYNVNYVSESQRSVLDEPMSLEMLQLLLERGLTPKGKGGLEKFFVRGGLLHYEKYQLLEYLLSRGLDPNASYFLHLLATIKPQQPATDQVVAMVALLLENGANPQLRNHQGQRPLQIAHKTYDLFKQRFQSHGAYKPSFKNVRTFRAAQFWKPGETCPICLEKLALTKAHTASCKRHLFHQSCLKKWNKKSLACPVCRHVATKPEVLAR